MKRTAIFLLVIMGLLVRCELTSDLGALKDGQCPSGKKGCAINGVWTCVDEASTDTSCGEKTCLSCAERLDNTKTAACDPSGLCIVAACADGWAPCAQQRLLGCETNIWTDAQNCGTCGNICMGGILHATPICTPPGNCAPLCLPGWLDCDGMYSTGCECGPNKVCINQVCM